MFKRHLWPKLIVVAVFIAAAAVAGREAAYVALTEEATVALPGRPAGEDVLNIRAGTVPGTCAQYNPWDWCVVIMPCAADGSGNCTTVGANCTPNSGTPGQYNHYCSASFYQVCWVFGDVCISNQVTGCKQVAGGCLCSDMPPYPAWFAGSSNQCKSQ